MNVLCKLSVLHKYLQNQRYQHPMLQRCLSPNHQSQMYALTPGDASAGALRTVDSGPRHCLRQLQEKRNNTESTVTHLGRWWTVAAEHRCTTDEAVGSRRGLFLSMVNKRNAQKRRMSSSKRMPDRRAQMEEMEEEPG